MIRLALIALVLTAAASAHAQPVDDPPRPPSPVEPGPRIERGFLGAGVLVGGEQFFHGALSLEAGIKLGELPLWLHATGSAGNSFDFEGGGGYWRGLGGVEMRSCSSSAFCLLGDLDVGYQKSTWDSGDEFDMIEDHRGAVIAGRVGFDAGGERVRFRAALEALSVHDHSNVAPDRWHTGLGLALGLAYRL